MKKKEYKISVIIPVYNVEKYLEETIESVVNQTIGFDNIQMILVNDGSPDNSEEICLKYKEKYPDNVVYVKQENAGVSSARNNGLKHATGKYVNFFDSDDIWDKNAYEKAIKFLDSNLSVDLVAFRLKFFEKSTDYRSIMPQFSSAGIVENQKLIEWLKNIAAEKKATPAQISLARMLAKNSILVPIPGTRNLKRLTENILAESIHLSVEEVTEIDDMLEHIPMSQVVGGSKVKK